MEVSLSLSMNMRIRHLVDFINFLSISITFSYNHFFLLMGHS